MAPQKTLEQKRTEALDERRAKLVAHIPEHVLEIFMPHEKVPDAPKRRGRPKHEPLPWQRALTRYLVGLGVPQRLVASEVGVGVDTLQTYYRTELDEGMDRANMLVTGSLFKKAISDTHPQAVTAAIWWDKTRGGKSETLNVNTNPAETPEEIDPKKASAQEAAAAYAATLMSDL